MKSYFLLGIASIELGQSALRAELGGQEDPWLILAGPDDPLAYFYVRDTLDGEAVNHIHVDISGRHYYEDDRVLATLARLQRIVGGTIDDDFSADSESD